MTDRRSSMAKPAKPKEVSFKEWLEHPEKYVRRGEVVQVVDKVIRLNELQKVKQSWWRRLLWRG